MNEIINQLFKSTHMESGKNMFENLLTFLKNRMKGKCSYEICPYRISMMIRISISSHVHSHIPLELKLMNAKIEAVIKVLILQGFRLSVV